MKLEEELFEFNFYSNLILFLLAFSLFAIYKFDHASVANFMKHQTETINPYTFE